MPFLIKTLVSALLIASASEIGKRTSWGAAIVASLPLTSLMTIIWLYVDTGDIAKVRDLSIGIFSAVVPSLLLLLVLYFLLKWEVRFWLALSISCVVMVASYALYVSALKRIGISL